MTPLETIKSVNFCPWKKHIGRYRSERCAQGIVSRRKPFKLVFEEKVITAGFRLHYYRQSVRGRPSFMVPAFYD